MFYKQILKFYKQKFISIYLHFSGLKSSVAKTFAKLLAIIKIFAMT